MLSLFLVLCLPVLAASLPSGVYAGRSVRRDKITGGELPIRIYVDFREEGGQKILVLSEVVETLQGDLGPFPMKYEYEVGFLGKINFLSDGERWREEEAPTEAASSKLRPSTPGSLFPPWTFMVYVSLNDSVLYVRTEGLQIDGYRAVLRKE